MKRLLPIVFISVLLLLSNRTVFAESHINVSAQHAVLMEAKTGRVMFEKDAHEKRPIASITKVMTALLAIEYGDLDDEVTVSKNASRASGSSIYLREGEKMSLEDLLYGLMLRSGNDAAIAIAEHIAGSVEGFVFLMNQKAMYLGMTNTNFKNPHGLDEDDHYSTAYDIALLMRHAMENEMFQKIQATKSYQSKQRDYRWYNKNRLLTGLYPYCTGGKTGYTNKAGRTLVTTAEKNDVRLIAVTLNAPDDWNDHIHMYESLFERLKNRMLDDKGPYDFFVDFEEELSAYMKEPVIIPVLDEEIPYLKKKVVLSRADDEEARIGKIVYQVRDEEVFQAPLYRDEGLFRFFVKQMGDVIGKMAGYP